jgi:hypothetical protein
MVYSQIAAYQVGVFIKDTSELNSFLEFVTRTENCVHMYGDEEELFENLCDSYGKVQTMLESIFGREYLEILFHLLDDAEARHRILSRVWKVMHGRERKIANQMYKVAPANLAKERTGANTHFQESNVLRQATMNELTTLKQRLTKASESFFLRCKQAVAELAITKEPSGNSFVRMFFRLVLLIEQYYATLAQPIPLENVSKWDVIRKEFFSRKTFLLRFPCDSVVVNEEFVSLIANETPDQELDNVYDRILQLWSTETGQVSRVDRGRSTNLINDWVDHEHLLNLFHRLDVDGDGLFDESDVDRLMPNLDEVELKILSDFRETAVWDAGKTYSFSDFLESDKEVAKRNQMHRVSSLLFKGKRISSRNALGSI